jgi:predicted RNA-binding protein with TRAM domain
MMRIYLNIKDGKRCIVSPKKRSPRNAKSKRGRGLSTAPVELGNEYDVDITETSPNGEGIAKIRGFAIFVPMAKLGDHVKVRIKNVNSIAADAEIVVSG